MPSYLRSCALALLLCAGCDAGKPHEGTPGLEPPHGTDDGGVPAAGHAGGTGTISGSAGSGSGAGSPATGTSGGGAAGASAMGGSGAGGGGVLSGGAGGGTVPDPGNADGGLTDGGALSFSELHADELMKDCQETVSCAMQRDEPLAADPIAACLKDSAALLDGDPSLQAAFLANVARCESFVVCDYFECAIRPL